jgi:hypothetical protein
MFCGRALAILPVFHEHWGGGGSNISRRVQRTGLEIVTRVQGTRVLWSKCVQGTCVP